MAGLVCDMLVSPSAIMAVKHGALMSYYEMTWTCGTQVHVERVNLLMPRVSSINGLGCTR
jgi:hypothetical protein